MTNADDGLIESAVSCDSCKIVVEEVVTLAGASLEGPATTMARGSDGSYYLAEDGVVRAYSPSGRFSHEIGGKGAGPGEFEVIRNVITDQQGFVEVLDAALARISRFRPSGELVSMAQIATTIGGLGMPAVLVSDGGLVANVRPSGAPDGSYAVIKFDTVGGALQRLAAVPSADLGRRWLHQRLLWARPNGELLIALPYAFSIERYAPDLSRVELVRFDAEWVPSAEPSEPPSDGLFDQPFTPRLGGVWEDADSVLWLYSVVPDPEWTPRRRPRDGHEGTYSDFVGRPRVQSIVEAVDFRQRRVLARLRVGGSLGAPFGGGYVVRSTEPAGEPGLRVSRIRLLR